MTDLSKVDPQAFLERVADEVSRRFRLGLPMARDGGGAGAPFCAVCETPGQCARQCSDQAEGIRQLGAARISGAPGIGPLDELIARSIDHTLLKPDATKEQITYLCAEAAKYGFASVCVNPFWVPYCAELLRGHPVAVCTVVGFPLGANPSEVKAHEARWAVEHGATEIDMVINIGALKSGLLDVVEEDIRAVKQACGRHVLKVILETALLDDHEKVAACEASMRAGADYVKTSTGFSTGGATAGDVALMRRVVGERAGVKASGGVRTKRDAALMLASGASRIGASAGVKILQEVPGLSGGVAKIARPAGGDAY